jgi:signal transduction histidine kinase
VIVFDIIRTAGWLVGTILHGVLFAVLLEGRRERGTPGAYVTLAAAALSWTLGNLLVVFLGQFAGDRLPHLTQAASAMAVVGFGVLPSGVIHAGVVARREQFARPRLVVTLGYLPALAAAPAAWFALLVPRDEFVRFFRETPALIALLGAWFIAALVIAGRAISRRPPEGDRGADGARAAQARLGRSFGLGLLLLGATLAAAAVIEIAAGTGASVVGETALLFVMLMSLLPGGLVVYYVYRYQYMDLRLRRGLSFAAVVLAVLLAHALIIRRITDWLEDMYGMDFALLEGALVAGVVLAFEPARRRLQAAIDAGISPRRAKRRAFVSRLQGEIAALAPGDQRLVAARTRAGLEEAFDARAVVVLDAPEDFASEDFASGSGGGPSGAGGSPGPVAAPVSAAREAGPLLEWAAASGPRPVRREALPPAAARAAEMLGLEHVVAVGGGAGDGARGGDGGADTDADTPTGFIGLATDAAALGEGEAAALTSLASTLAAAARSARVVRRLVALEGKLAEAERLSSLGRLSATIAHEVKNPLSSIKTIVSVLRGELAGNEQASADLDVISDEVARLSTVVTNLLGVARPGKPPGEGSSLMLPPGGFDAREMLEGLLAVLGPDARRRGIEIETRFSPDTPRAASRESRIRSAAFQIILNAIEVTPEGGKVTVATGPSSESGKAPQGPGGRPGVAGGQAHSKVRPALTGVEIVVEDAGPGLPPGREDRVFDEFFSSKPGGTGLGLSIAKAEVEQAGGRIEAGWRADGERGARFRITLPAARRVAPT